MYPNNLSVTLKGEMHIAYWIVQLGMFKYISNSTETVMTEEISSKIKH